MRRGADARFDITGRIDRQDHRVPARHDVHAARGESRAAVAGALGEGRKADAEMTAFGALLLLPRAEGGNVDGLHRHFQHLLVTGLVVNQAHRRGVGKLVDQVAAADIDRIDGEGGRRLVHQPLQREGDHRARHAAIGRHGAGVGEHAARAAFVGAEIVRSRHLGHSHQRFHAAGGRVTRIGADIGDDVGPERDEFGVLVERAFQRHVLVARMKGGDQVLAPVLGPGHRAF